MPKLEELFELLSFNSEKALLTIHFLCNIIFAYQIYIGWFDGIIIWPEEISYLVVVDFFTSLQFVIPLVLYFISWLIFSFLLPFLCRLVIVAVFNYLYYQYVGKRFYDDIQNHSQSDLLELLDILNAQTRYLGITFNADDLKEDVLNEDSDEDAQEAYHFRTYGIIVLIQLVILLFSSSLVLANLSTGPLWLILILLTVITIVFVLKNLLYLFVSRLQMIARLVFRDEKNQSKSKIS